MSNENSSYEDALKQAQKLGYAEFNPTADVEGFDATYKLSILSSLAFNKKIAIENVYREGITKINKEDISYGKKLGYTLKLLAIGKDTEKGVEVRVHPTFIKNDNPLASVNDSFNAVSVIGDAVGEIMLYGRGAGALPTGSAIVSDIIFAGRHTENFYVPFKNNEKGNKEVKFTSDFETQYYIRLTVSDKAGVLAKITSAFAKANISLKELTQSEAKDGKAEIVVITHVSSENDMNKTLEKISAMTEVETVNACIRIEE